MAIETRGEIRERKNIYNLIWLLVCAKAQPLGWANKQSGTWNCWLCRMINVTTLPLYFHTKYKKYNNKKKCYCLPVHRLPNLLLQFLIPSHSLTLLFALWFKTVKKRIIFTNFSQDAETKQNKKIYVYTYIKAKIHRWQFSPNEFINININYKMYQSTNNIIKINEI